jgi:hypothetical protein
VLEPEQEQALVPVPVLVLVLVLVLGRVRERGRVQVKVWASEEVPEQDPPQASAPRCFPNHRRIRSRPDWPLTTSGLPPNAIVFVCPSILSACRSSIAMRLRPRISPCSNAELRHQAATVQKRPARCGDARNSSVGFSDEKHRSMASMCLKA